MNSSDLWTINPLTGAGTFVANITGTDSCLMGLAFDGSDNLFATSWCAGNSPLYEINPVTGVAGIVGFTGIANPHGGDINPIPEPSSIVLVASGFIGLAGTLRRRLTR